MGSQKKEAILHAKWAVNFVQKAKWAKNELCVSGLHGSSHVLLVQPSSAAAVIFGGLPGTLCYVAIQPCSLELCLHFNYSMEKKEFLESKMGERERKMGESEKQYR